MDKHNEPAKTSSANPEELPMRRIVDLSHTLRSDAPRSTDHPQVRFEGIRWFSRHGAQTHSIEASLHSGTHMDAPALYFQEKNTIDKVPVERLVGPGVVIDAQRDAWGEITAADLESSDPSIREGDIVVLYTGWSRYYGIDDETYVLKAPGLTRDAVDWLVETNVNMVCADQPSAEHIFMRLPQWKQLRSDIFGDVEGDDERFPRSYGHKTFFANDILMIDHVGGDIASIVGERCTIGAFVAKYGDVEAAPVRMLAFLDT